MVRMSDAERNELWDRWEAGESERLCGSCIPVLREPQEVIFLVIEKPVGVRIPESITGLGNAKEIPGVIDAVASHRPRKTCPSGSVLTTEAAFHQHVFRIVLRDQGERRAWAGRFMFGGAVFGECCFFRSGTTSRTKLGLARPGSVCSGR